MEYKIIPEKEHVIITDIDDNFICSCDNYKEAEQEIKEMEMIKWNIKSYMASVIEKLKN